MTDPTGPQSLADAMVADTGGFEAGDLVRIKPAGLAASVAAVFGGRALCYLANDDGGWLLGRWVPVGDLERR